MKQANLIEQTKIISQPNEDPFAYLVEHIDSPSVTEESDASRRLAVDSVPES